MDPVLQCQSTAPELRSPAKERISLEPAEPQHRASYKAVQKSGSRLFSPVLATLLFPIIAGAIWEKGACNGCHGVTEGAGDTPSKLGCG